ncbi:MAG: DUF4919 domain-containing protein [Deltaproteobacteria bacterium]|nr:MAG: DUF4919 domain-containing protein [Deltaproteobacteria bacterium]
MDSRFDALLLDVRTDPTRADYSALRIAWTECSRYQPYGRDSEGLEELHMRVASKRFEEAVRLAKRLLEAEPLSVSLHLLYAQALDGLGDDWDAGDHRAIAHGLCKAILRSGDGRSAATALVVVEPWEIKLALDLLGLASMRSEQRQEADRWYDCVLAIGKDGEREVWFDVTHMQNWLAQTG